MKRLLQLRSTLIGFCLILISTQAFSHHSRSEFDLDNVVETEGRLVNVFWKNPHVILDLAVQRDGKEVILKLEGSSISGLRRRGIEKELLTIGETIRIAGFASERRPTFMLVNNVLLKNNVEIVLSGGRQQWPNSTLAGNEDANKEIKIATAKAEADGIFRVWTWGRLEPGWWFFGGPENFPLTDAAKASVATWNEYTDNPQTECIAPGMPATMGNPYPIQFVQVGDNIEIREEEFDVVRTIYLDGTPDTASQPSHLGHSIGRWIDKNTLEITTTKINWYYFNRVGVPQSEAVTVHERFTVANNGEHLDYELTVTDPATLTKAFNWKARWNWVPGEEVGKYGCTVES
jgi:hypothetical protein